MSVDGTIAAPPPVAGAGVFWPSRYGADDEAGALNEITPAHVARAARAGARGATSSISPTCSTSTYPPSRAAASTST